jgi:hypothetical protein
MNCGALVFPLIHALRRALFINLSLLALSVSPDKSYTSKFATDNAFFSMNSLRGST